jgi:hypothetical protein
MTIVSNTVTRYDPNSIREDLSSVISNISPTDTPLLSMSGKANAKNTYHEWQTDTLAAAITTNNALDGDDLVSTTSTAAMTVRVGNYTQISRKLITVSGTARAVDNAGYKDELAYQVAKRSQELKRDMEACATSDQVAVVGGPTTARKTGALGGWIITNASVGAGAGAVPQMSSGSATTNLSGYPLTIAVAGTARAFTESLLKTNLQNVWTQGGSLDYLMVGPFNKTVVTNFAGIATRTKEVKGEAQAAIIAAADVYVSDFGTVKVIANRFSPASTAYTWDPEMTDIAYLRPYSVETLAKTGDADKRMLIVEWALKVKNQAGLGAVRDLTTS